MFPELAPIVDFGQLAPGCESIEVVSIALLAALERRFEQPLFLAFCEINSERLLDAIAQILERGVYPFDSQEILAEVCFKLFDRWFLAKEREATSESSSRGAMLVAQDAAATGSSIYAMLVELAKAIIGGQVERIRGLQIPLPGVPFPKVSPGEATISRGARVLLRRGTRISEVELRRWVATALLDMPEQSRRLLYLREQRQLSAREVAAATGLKPFEVVLETRRAGLELDARLTALLERFTGPTATVPREATPSREPTPPGRIIPMRKSSRGVEGSDPIAKVPGQGAHEATSSEHAGGSAHDPDGSEA